jgi:hypothetical protein
MAYTALFLQNDMQDFQREDQIQVFPGAMAICLAYPVGGPMTTMSTCTSDD